LARSAQRETPLSAFLFDRFFFAPPSCKEKSAVEFREQHGTRFLSENFLKEVFRHLSRTFPNDFYSVMGYPSSQDLGTTDCRQVPPRPCRRSRKSEFSHSLPPGGRWVLRSKSRKEPAMAMPYNSQKRERRESYTNFIGTRGGRGGTIKGVSQMPKCIWYSPPTFSLCG